MQRCTCQNPFYYPYFQSQWSIYKIDFYCLYSSVTSNFAWNGTNIRDLKLDKLHIIIDAEDACNFIKQVSFYLSLEHADEVKKNNKITNIVQFTTFIQRSFFSLTYL